MKTCVATICIGPKYEKIAEISHPLMRAYAEKIGADFVVWKDAGKHSLPAYQKLELYRLLEEYDRVLFLDTDILVRDDAPDLFEVVPETHLGLFNEGQYLSRIEAMDLMARLTGRLEFSWKGSYYNTGVIVASHHHREAFRPTDFEPDNFYEQTFLNFRFWEGDFLVHELSHKFNRMSCMDRITGEQRFDSFFLHYAGHMGDVAAQMIADLAAWDSRVGDKWPRKICIKIAGGLGDEISFEPAIRFMIREFYANDDVTLFANRPELFQHLPCKVRKHGDGIRDEGHFVIDVGTDVTPIRSPAGSLALTRMHGIDWFSTLAWGGSVPSYFRTVQLPNFREKMPEKNWSRVVAVHAGRGWPTKSFPEGFWRMVCERLVKFGLKPVLIGKNQDDGYFGALSFEQEGVTSVVDRLSLELSIGLIQKAVAVISSDSFPIHAAGSCEAFIGLVSPVKEPWLVLPFRNGSQAYRTDILCHGEPWRIAGTTEPNRVSTISLDSEAFVPAVLESLPSPDQIDGWIRKFLPYVDFSRP